MIRQRVGRDVVRLDERRVKQIAQCDRVARLKADVIFAGADERFGRNRRRSDSGRRLVLSAQSSTTIAVATFVRLPI